MNAEEIKVTTGYTVHFTPEDANGFYNDAYRMGRDHPESFEGARRDYPEVFGVFDVLSVVGVDGTG